MDQDAYEEDYDQDNLELNKKSSVYQEMEETISRIHMKIKDFLYESGESDLLAYWGFDQTAECIYDLSYIKQLIKEEENPL